MMNITYVGCHPGRSNQDIRKIVDFQQLDHCWALRNFWISVHMKYDFEVEPI